MPNESFLTLPLEETRDSGQRRHRWRPCPFPPGAWR